MHALEVVLGEGNDPKVKRGFERSEVSQLGKVKVALNSDSSNEGDDWLGKRNEVERLLTALQ